MIHSSSKNSLFSFILATSHNSQAFLIHLEPVRKTRLHDCIVPYDILSLSIKILNLQLPPTLQKPTTTTIAKILRISKNLSTYSLI